MPPSDSAGVVAAADLSWAERLRPRDFAAASDARVAELATLAKRLFG